MADTSNSLPFQHLGRQTGNRRQATSDQLLPLVYQELRDMARQLMSQEFGCRSLDPTGLVHEAYLKLSNGLDSLGDGTMVWNSPGHFYGAAAQAMRRILVDLARERRSQKRGGELQRQPLNGTELDEDSWAARWLLLDAAMERLAADEPPAAQVAHLRLFAGLSVGDAAEALGISRATAFRYWAYARAKLAQELGELDDPSQAGPVLPTW